MNYVWAGAPEVNFWVPACFFSYPLIFQLVCCNWLIYNFSSQKIYELPKLNKLKKLFLLIIVLFVLLVVFVFSYFIFSSHLASFEDIVGDDALISHQDPSVTGKPIIAKQAIVKEVIRDEHSLILSDVNNSEFTMKVDIDCLGSRAELKVLSDNRVSTTAAEVYIFDNVTPGDGFRYLCSGDDCTKAEKFCAIIKSSE